VKFRSEKSQPVSPIKIFPVLNAGRNKHRSELDPQQYSLSAMLCIAYQNEDEHYADEGHLVGCNEYRRDECGGVILVKVFRNDKTRSSEEKRLAIK
jgi:hypothetical protein